MNSLAELDALIGKCRDAEELLSRTHGGFALFALFERSDFLGSWDVVVASPWFESDDKIIHAVVDQMTPLLSKAEWLSVSRVVPLRPDADFVRTINRLVTTKHAVREFFSLGVLHGVAINHAFVITSDADPAGVTALQTAASPPPPGDARASQSRPVRPGRGSGRRAGPASPGRPASGP